MFKRIASGLLALTLLSGTVTGGVAYAADTVNAPIQDLQTKTPLIWADVPDVSVIRVGSNYYMSSTTMHMNPGVPIMKSTDLVNWEIVNYVYDVLETDNDQLALRNGQSAYGKGSWASSLRYNNGTYYIAFPSYTTGKTYIYHTQDIEDGTWDRAVLDGVYHDLSLLMDQDGKSYLIYGGNEIRIRELNEDVTAVKDGGLDQIIIPDAGSVAQEGCHMAEGSQIFVKDGKYYLMLISWPSDSERQVLCYTADSLTGDWSGKVVFKDGGIAQGGIFDTPDGKWYAMLFQDHGAVGRSPYLVPVTWAGADGFPVFGDNGKLPTDLGLDAIKMNLNLVQSDEFYQYSPMMLSANEASDEEGAAVLSAAPKELLVNGDFEAEDVSAWVQQDPATLTRTAAPAGEAHGQTLKVTGRTVGASGPAQSIAGKAKAGNTYQFSADVYYDDPQNLGYPDTKWFHLCLQSDPGDYRTIKIIGEANAAKGAWGTITGSYTIPADTDVSNAKIFIETPWAPTPSATEDLMDFYADNVSFADVTPDTNLVANGGFAESVEPWTANGSAQLSLVTEDAYSEPSSLKITNRVLTGDGPRQDLSSKLQAGHQYEVTAKVKYTEGPDNKNFNVTAISNANGVADIMASGNITKGEWGNIRGTYTFSADGKIPANQASIFLETPWTPTPDATNDLMDFCVDDVSVVDVTPDTPTDSYQPGENDDNGSVLNPVWQWNHNPDNRLWSLTDRQGYLRLTTGRTADSILSTRNTLTQRTFGPVSSGSVAVEVSQMKNGDYAGLAAFQNKYGFAGVKMVNGEKHIVQVSGQGATDGAEETMTENASVAFEGDRVYFKVDCDYRVAENGWSYQDDAYFYYSLDGASWTKFGEKLDMEYSLTHFMGYRFALFNYATKTTGGYVDFDYFRVEGELTDETPAGTTVNASMTNVSDVLGVQNMELEIPITMDALPAGTYSSISASFNIPNQLTVADVVFNTANVTGQTSYSYANNRLQLRVSGADTSFANQGDNKLFATVKLKVANFVPQDTTASVTTDYITAQGSAKVSYDVTKAVSAVSLKALDTEAIAKVPGYGNPLISHRLGADPFAITYDGRVYIYMSSDEVMYDENGNTVGNNFANLNRVLIISSDDMVNWTDHGYVQVGGEGGVAAWAGASWAPAAAHKKIDGVDKFFLYFSNGAGGIGVLEANSPVGPWTDPIGRALITQDTPGVTTADGDKVVWLFDPAALVDDNGDGYLYFGGGIPNEPNTTPAQYANPKSGRVIKLGEDMTSIEGEAKLIDAPYLFEDSGIHKNGDKYYYSYCAHFGPRYPELDTPTAPGGEICYMVSDNPMGPFEYVGPILKNPGYFFDGTGGNNHHAVFQFNDVWYIVYHAQTVSAAMGEGLGYRSPHINELRHYSDGSIQDIAADRVGISQLKTLNPYATNQAETIAWNQGIETAQITKSSSNSNMMVTKIHNGDWLAVSNADFGENGAASFTARMSAAEGGAVKIYLDNPGNADALIGTLDVSAANGEWKNMTCDVQAVPGVHTVFFVFEGQGSEELFSMDEWTFAGEQTVAVTGVALNQSALNLKTTETAQLTATVAPTNATNRNVTWSSSNTAAATVSDSGLVTAVSVGDAVITVTTADGGKTAACTVAVTKSGNSSSSSGGSSTSGKPSASVSGTGGKISASTDGSVTITPDAGYEIGKVTVNGAAVSIPANGKLTGLKPTDKVVVTFTKTAAPDESGFSDMTNHWAKDAVDYVVKNGLFNGTSANTFAPDTAMTRGMVMTVLARLSGQDTTGGAVWYEKGMDWAKQQGVSDGTNPEAMVTREQLAVMLYRYAGCPEVQKNPLNFSDAAKLSPWASDAMLWATQNGIITGKNGGLLDPQGNATRAEVATMLMRMAENGSK